MKGPIAYPFLRPAPARISALWNFKPKPNAQAQIPEWDVHTPIAFTTIVNIDHQGIRADCQLDERACMALSATWNSSGTKLRGLCQTVDVNPTGADAEDYVLSAELAPNELAGSVEVAVVLHLGQPTSRVSRMGALAPKLVGSILWRESRVLTLEGSGSRFPIEAKRFAADPRLPGNAAWYLDWDPGAPTETLLGAVRLLLNDDHPAIHSYLRDDAGGPVNQSIASFLKLDVADQLIGGMLRCREFTDGSVDLPQGSVGRHVSDLLSICFPGESLPSLASRRAQDESYFRAQLQQALMFLRTAST